VQESFTSAKDLKNLLDVSHLLSGFNQNPSHVSNMIADKFAGCTKNKADGLSLAGMSFLGTADFSTT
jgi:hypothetical protein